VVAALGNSSPALRAAGPAAAPPASPQDRFERALAVLDRGGDARQLLLGPYHLFTDVQDDELLGHLAVVAGDVDRAYQERYGLQLAPHPSEAVVLFAREDDYLAYLGVRGEDRALAGGHTSGGVAILAAGDREPREVKTLLVHELVHLVNRRAFGDRAQPWIEEGTSDDIAFCHADKEGEQQLGTLGGISVVSARPGGLPGGYLISRSFTGGLASLKHLLDMFAARRLIPIPELTSLSWGEFREPHRRPLRYAESAFLLRFLFDWRKGRRAAASRTFLSDFAAGGPGDGEALRAHLEESWESLDRDFRRYLRRQARVPR
jgi:hypothetical protein